MKHKWLDRRIAAPGPYLTLVLSADEFKQALKPLNLSVVPEWMGSSANATTHFLDNANGELCAVVCLGSEWKNRGSIEVAGLLVHEAVHIWQWYCKDIGEREPGTEQEAYGVQCIAQELLSELARRMENGTA